jgi:hypothetical protein
MVSRVEIAGWCGLCVGAGFSPRERTGGLKPASTQKRVEERAIARCIASNRRNHYSRVTTTFPLFRPVST